MTVEEKDSSKLLPTDPEWKWGPVRGDSQRETDIWVLYGDPQFSSVAQICANHHTGQIKHINPCPIHSLFLLLGVLVISSTN